MTLASGTKLGTYEVTSHIGSGGMGEVYQVRDSKLGRDVAIKVLPARFALDPERLARFQREAKLLAALNHPNIATIHDLEQSGDTHYLVMELVSGDTLAQKITRDGALPTEEALKIARQIAEALEAAHEKTIIHRDLKPANVKVTSEGRVKVLDFGLAKVFALEAATEDPSNSPTLSMNPTLQGMIMGTAAYMSPEQARGRHVNRSTDIWAFGAVLYELLTGKQAFHGEDVAEILAAVMKTEPDWSALPADTPHSIRTLLRRCLRKDRRQRLQDASSLRIEIEESLAASPEGVVANAAPAATRGWQRPLLLSLATLIIGAAISAILVWDLKPMAVQPISRLALPLPLGERLPTVQTPVLAISPDGSRIAFVSSRDGKQQIYLRSFDSTDMKPLPGTEGAENLFFSPDGRWLGFAAGGKLMRVSMEGGAPLTICDAPFTRGASWGDNGTIVFASNYGNQGLSQVSAAGGKAKAITTRDGTWQEEGQRWPQLLPGGKAVLFTAWNRDLDNAEIIVQRLDTRERRTILRGGTYARYVPSGQLVYARAGNLMAAPFNLSELETTGDPVPLAESVVITPEAAAQFDVSHSGSLVYVPGDPQGTLRRLVWVDSTGAEQPLAAPPRNYLYPRVSPNGQQIVLTVQGGNDDDWVYDIPHQTLTRLTFQFRSLSPIWTPDGKRIIYRSSRAGVLNLFWKPADGSSDEERLTTSPNNQTPLDVSPDSQSLLYMENANGNQDLWVLPLMGDRKPRPFLQTSFNEGGGSFSPDGRWLAYFSNESGRNEVYVRPFPAGGQKVQISTEGGSAPRWARNSALFFSSGDKMMAIDLNTQRDLIVGSSHPLFNLAAYYTGGAIGGTFDVSSDGRRLLMIKESERAAATQISVVLNWLEDLKHRVPAGTK